MLIQSCVHKQTANTCTHTSRLCWQLYKFTLACPPPFFLKMPSLIPIYAVIPNSSVLAEPTDGKICKGKRNVHVRAEHVMRRGARRARRKDAATFLMSLCVAQSGDIPREFLRNAAHTPASPINLDAALYRYSICCCRLVCPGCSCTVKVTRARRD